MSGYPVILLSSRQQSQLSSKLGKAVNDWKNDWFLRDKNDDVVDAKLTVSLTQKFLRTNNSYNYSYENNGSDCSIVADANQFASLLAHIVPNYKHSQTINDSELGLIESTIVNLIEKLTGEKVNLKIDDNHQECKSFKWFTCIEIDDSALFLELPGQWLSKEFSVEKSSRDKVNLNQALTNEQVYLTAHLKTMSIKAADALTLKKGEVIKLEHKIFEPLNLVINGSLKPVTQCYLGKTDSNKSLVIS